MFLEIDFCDGCHTNYILEKTKKIFFEQNSYKTATYYTFMSIAQYRFIK